MTSGILYICATPIGNLEDITLRVLRVLGEVDLIAAEDTRHTAKLLAHYEIKTPMTSYHENNREAKGAYLIERLQNGANVALVSDSGLPGISDPGRELVLACHEHGIGVTVCPGASAGLAGLVLSGFRARPHVFEGFLPRDKAARRRVLESQREAPRTVVLYEAPHRLLATLREMMEILGDRQIALARELTKKFEEISFGAISEIIAKLEERPPRGEFVIVVEGAGEIAPTYPEDIMFHVEQLIAQGHGEKDAIKMAAKARGLAKSEVYNKLKRK
ncbi:MAG: 16S rRNA (cytidine(1402)-2'-O)-methyltransferase [Clostridiales bacterium]|nr:16S rRNA (cytidine(1402)-2'-O)-methyltransferase [Clostridiales bacterium]